MDFQDLITYEIKGVMLIENEELWNIMIEDNYNPIFIALRKGPMTVKDLEEAYNQIVNEKIEKMAVEQKEKNLLKEKLRRRDKTLYKYLDFLQKHGVIIQVGKRVRMGQTATETLYGRAAIAFIYAANKREVLTADDKNKSLKVVEKILTLDKGISSISMECFIKIYNKILINIDEEKERIFQTYNDEITKVSSNLSFEDMKKLIFVLEIVDVILNAKQLQNDIEKCFVK